MTLSSVEVLRRRGIFVGGFPKTHLPDKKKGKKEKKKEYIQYRVSFFSPAQMAQFEDGHGIWSSALGPLLRCMAPPDPYLSQGAP